MVDAHFGVWDTAVNMRDKNSLSFWGMIIRINSIAYNQVLKGFAEDTAGEEDGECWSGGGNGAAYSLTESQKRPHWEGDMWANAWKEWREGAHVYLGLDSQGLRQEQLGVQEQRKEAVGLERSEPGAACLLGNPCMQDTPILKKLGNTAF